MTVHESGDKGKPVIMLFPGTMCYWKGNFGGVIDELKKTFLVAAVAYTGFDEEDTESYASVEDELEKIEQYIIDNYGGRICAAYGCSLGGTFVAHLTARHRVHIQYGIIGSADMDQAGKLKADILTGIMVKATYSFIHTGRDSSRLMQKRFKK